MATVTPLSSRTDVISHVLGYCPLNDFLYLAGVSKVWDAAWVTATPACGGGGGSRRPKRTSISMAALTPTRMEVVLDDGSFWLFARQQVMMMTMSSTMNNTRSSDITTNDENDDNNNNNNNNRSSNNSNNNKSNIFCVTAAAGNLFGLKAAVTKLGGESTSSGGHSPWTTTTTSITNSCCGWTRASTDDDTTINVPFARRRVPELAAEFGHFDVLRWAVSQQGCPLNPSVWFFAAKVGDLNVLEWLSAQGCPRDLYGCTAGASSTRGNLAALRWSRERGHGWDRFVCYSASRLGDLEMLRWARDQGCPWDPEECAGVAVSSGHPTVAAWIHHHQIWPGVVR